ncbi:MAG: diacylglycerol kinase family lipid kinase [Gemmatimonadaceae bacterium]|nr:diacylglycerol kinase family lipid kinase [Gemmatimonadaceae bacterium]
MNDRITVIVNPASGRGRGLRLLPDIRKTFAAVGITDVQLTERPGDETRLAALALHNGATTIVACGGDGTWSNAANAILSSGADCRLALLAAGTGNDFAKTVGAPARDLAATARLVAEGAETLVDVGRIEDRYFLNVTGFGFDIAVLDDLENIPMLTGDLLYLSAALRQLFKFRGVPIDITTTAVARGPRAHLMLIIANGRNFGGMFQIAPDARANDGKLDAISILDASPLTRISMLAAAPSGKHVRNPLVLSEQAASFTLKFDAPPAYETDGEYNRAKSSTLEISCVPGALRVAAPMSRKA